MVQMLEGPLGACLLADEMGLDKTLATLTTIQILADRKIAARQKMSPVERKEVEFKPNLILFPSAAALAWKDTLFEKFKPLKLFYWMSSVGKHAESGRATIIGSKVSDFFKFYDKECDPNNPLTSRILILSTIQTYLGRSVGPRYRKEDSLENPIRKGFQKRRRTFEEDEPEADEAQALADKDLNDMKTYLPDVWGLMVIDEAQKVKNDKTDTAHAILLHGMCKKILITATPSQNRVTQVWHAPSFEGSKELTVNDYRLMSQGYREGKFTEGNFKERLAFLNPNTLGDLVYRRGREQVSAEEASDLLSVILGTFCLRRCMKQKLELGALGDTLNTIIIGDDVPPFVFITVEVSMNTDQAKLYHASHPLLMKRLKGLGFDEDTGEGQQSMQAHCSACLLTFNPLFDTFRTKNIETGVREAQSVMDDHMDYGVTWFYQMTTKDLGARASADRIALAFYLPGSSPKLQWFLGYAYEVTIVRKEKLLVFCNWPFNLWYIVMLLMNMCFSVLELRSSHTSLKREKIIRKFNDPNDHHMIVVTSTLTT